MLEPPVKLVLSRFLIEEAITSLEEPGEIEDGYNLRDRFNPARYRRDSLAPVLIGVEINISPDTSPEEVVAVVDHD